MQHSYLVKKKKKTFFFFFFFKLNFHNLGTKYRQNEKLESAVWCLQSGVFLAIELKDKFKHLAMLFAIGEIFAELKKFDESNDYFFESLAISGPNVLDRVSLYVGENYFNMQKYENSKRFLSQAEKLFIMNKNYHSIVRSLRTLATCLERMEQWDEAIEVIKRREGIVSEMLKSKMVGDVQTDMELIIIFEHLAEIFFHLEKWEKVIEYYLRFIPLVEKYNRKVKNIWAHNRVGISYKNLGNYPLSLQYHQKELELAQSLNQEKAISVAKENLSSLSLLMNQSEEKK